jgi:hypothetical protein
LSHYSCDLLTFVERASGMRELATLENRVKVGTSTASIFTDEACMLEEIGYPAVPERPRQSQELIQAPLLHPDLKSEEWTRRITVVEPGRSPVIDVDLFSKNTPRSAEESLMSIDAALDVPAVKVVRISEPAGHLPEIQKISDARIDEEEASQRSVHDKVYDGGASTEAAVAMANLSQRPDIAVGIKTELASPGDEMRRLLAPVKEEHVTGSEVEMLRTVSSCLPMISGHTKLPVPRPQGPQGRKLLSGSCSLPALTTKTAPSSVVDIMERTAPDVVGHFGQSLRGRRLDSVRLKGPRGGETLSVLKRRHQSRNDRRLKENIPLPIM